MKAWKEPGLALPIHQSSTLAIENSIWLKKSATDEIFGEDTNHLSNNTPAGVPRKDYKALRQTSVKTMFSTYTLSLPCYF